MDAGMLMLTILCAVIGALAAGVAGAALSVMLLAYAICGTAGLFGFATWKVLRVADFETTRDARLG
jgi:hypothetical protein